MSFVGRLDQFRLTDVLQILAMGEKSGKIKLTRRDAEGVVVLQRGKLIYAASSSARETLGHLLISEGLIEEEALVRALEVQHKSVEEKRLGACLVEMGVLDEEQIERVVIRQIERVVIELMQWKGGYFKFEPMDLSGTQEIAVDAENLLLSQGLSAETVLLHAGEEVNLEDTQELLAVDFEALDAPEAQSPSRAEEGLAALKTIMREIRSAELTGEATARILNYASQVVHRAVLFVVRSESFVVLSQKGVEAAEDLNERLRALRVPASWPSILQEAAGRKETCRGPLAEVDGNREVVETLGGGWPHEAVAIPMMIEDKVDLVVYGDDVGGPPIGSTAELEMLILQIGLATEKSLLEKRLAQLEGSRAGS